MLKVSEDTPVLYSGRCDRLNGIPFARDSRIIPLRYAQITNVLTDIRNGIVPGYPNS